MTASPPKFSDGIMRRTDGLDSLTETEGGIVIVMFNMAFRMENLAAEAAFIAGLELTGVRVRNNRGTWFCWGLSEDDRAFIEQNATQFWAL